MNISPVSIIKSPNTTLIGQSILCYPRVPSTMDIAREIVKGGVEEGTVIVAWEQTRGRGRFDRSWLSPQGKSLSLSIILRPDLTLLPQLNMVACLAVVQSVERITALQPSIKWPNDILINGRKLSGILIENIFEGNALEASIIGIGMNIELDPSDFPEISPIATSLYIESGRYVSRRDMLFALLEEFDELYRELYLGAPIYERWLTRLETTGKLVQVKVGNTIEEGYAESINTDGSLILKRQDGSLITIVAGEITLHN